MRRTTRLLASSRFLFSAQTNYFKLFDLPYDFNQQQLKSSYLLLVRKYHPDLTKDESAADIFREVQKGYEVLSDQTTRREHQASQVTPGDSAQQSVVDEMVDRFYNKYERKDPINDEFSFSYKLFKEHYEKVEAPKKEYQRYEGQGGEEYYDKRGDMGERTWRHVAAASSALGVLVLAYTYTHW